MPGAYAADPGRMQAAARIARRAAAGPPPGSALLVVGSVFLAASGIAGLALGAELARPGIGFLSATRYNDLLFDHATFATELGLWPLWVGAALALARTGRALGLLGAALLAAGGIVVYDALRQQAVIGYGWTSYAPRTALSHLDHIQRELGIGTALALAGIACATLPLLRRRSPFATAVAASAGVLPFLVVQQVARAAGAFWSTPQHVAFAAVALPAVGAAGEVVARSTGRPLPGLYRIALAAFVVVAAAVWLEHTIRAPFGESDWESTVLALPVAVAIAAVLWVGAPRGRPTLAVLFAASALLLLVAGGALGAVVATKDPTLHWMDTQLVDAHFHAALLGGGFCGLLALAHATWPRLDKRLGGATLVLLLAGTGAFVASDAVAGLDGMPRRVVDYAPRFAGVSLASTVGGALTAAAVAIFALDAALAWRRRLR